MHHSPNPGAGPGSLFNNPVPSLRCTLVTTPPRHQAQPHRRKARNRRALSVVPTRQPTPVPFPFPSFLLPYLGPTTTSVTPLPTTRSRHPTARRPPPRRPPQSPGPACPQTACIHRQRPARPAKLPGRPAWPSNNCAVLRRLEPASLKTVEPNPMNALELN